LAPPRAAHAMQALLAGACIAVTLPTKGHVCWLEGPARGVRCAPPAMGDAGQDDFARRAAAAAEVNLGSASSDAASRLGDLEAKAAQRLEALGAGVGPAPSPPAPAERSEFTMSSAASKRAEAEEMLRRIRAKDRAELEEPNRSAIEAARAMAKQWLDAGLPARAEQELSRVAQYVSFRSDLGSSFHLQLASIVQKNGKQAEARKLRQRVMKDAESSSARWQAERDLNGGAGPSSAGSSSSSTAEMGNLFRLPDQWS